MTETMPWPPVFWVLLQALRAVSIVKDNKHL
jgi:hypothetical protein